MLKNKLKQKLNMAVFGRILCFSAFVAEEKMPLKHKDTKIHKKSFRHILIQYIEIQKHKIQTFMFHFSKTNYPWKIADSYRD